MTRKELQVMAASAVVLALLTIACYRAMQAHIEEYTKGVYRDQNRAKEQSGR